MLDFLKKLFGLPSGSQQNDRPDEELGVRLIGLSRRYWTVNANEKAALVARIDALSPAELLRLHHLNCLDMLASVRRATPDGMIRGAAPPQGEELDLCTRLLPRLAGPKGPFRPRRGQVWQVRRGVPHDADRAPDKDGALINASLTHLGALEIIRLEGNTPSSVDFIAFDDLRAVHIGPPSLFRPARVYLESQRDPDDFVPALLPLLYGASWASTDDHDTDGSMTRFVFHVEGVIGERGLGMGIGHQDFTFADGGVLFGLGSLESIAFALDPDAPDFAARCHGRGLDPDEVRRKDMRTHGAS